MLEERNGIGLWEAWKRHYHNRGFRSQASVARSRFAATVFFLGTAVAELYCMVLYAIPFYYKDYGPQVIYWVKVTACFVFVNSMANWLCARFYTSAMVETRDRPRRNGTLWDDVGDGDSVTTASRANSGFEERMADRERQSLRENRTSASAVVVVQEGMGAETDSAAAYCDLCQRPRPPLSHHCRNCNACILRRDHHCYLLGRCVGYYNQRYFVVLCFYVGVASVLGQVYGVHYLRSHTVVVAEASTVEDSNAGSGIGSWLLAPHVIAGRYLAGSMPLHVALMACLCYYLWLFAIIGAGYFALQMEIVRRGVTLYQFRKGMAAPRGRRRTANENFREVFGDFWALNFLFPAQLLFRLKPAPHS